MAKYRITSPDGQSFEITAPEGATPQQVQEFAQRQFSTMRQQPAGPAGNAADGGAVGGIKQGLRDPIDAGAQMLRRIVPEPVAQAVDAAGNWLADRGLPVARSEGVAGVDSIVRNANAQYEADRTAAGRSGFDAARLVGNVASPVNLALPSATGANTVLQLAVRGAVAGGAGAALQPVTENAGDFWTTKAQQVGIGAITGGVATPLLSKGATALATSAKRAMQNRTPQTVIIGNATQGLTRADLDNAVATMLQSQGIRAQDAPKVVLDSVRRQIAEALAEGAKLNPTQALRKAEAEALGMTGDAALTLGQVTRDPMRFAQERNLSGVVIHTPAGPTNPLTQRFSRQNQVLASIFDDAGMAADRVTAGEGLLGTLSEANKRADRTVRQAYDAFRTATGRDLEIPLQGLAQDFAATVDRFDDAIPGAVRKKFEGLGLMGGRQRQMLTIEGAEDLIKTINANTDPMNRRASRALGELRSAVERAITEAADTAPTGASAEAAQLGKEARTIAAGVFQSRRDVPALKAALDDIAPDRFVDRFLIGAPTRDVDGLMAVLKNDPASLGQARAQVLRYLQRAAFGENPAGDKVFAPERYTKALQALGPQKLRLFFSPDEAVRLNLAGKVAAEINSAPAGAEFALNRSGTAAGVFNLFQRLAEAPGVRQIPGVRSISNQIGEIANERAIGAALAPTSAATKQPTQLSPEAVRALQRLFAPAAVAFGAASGSGQ